MTTGDDEDKTQKICRKYHLIYQGDKQQNPTVVGQIVLKIVLTLFLIVVPANIHTSSTDRNFFKTVNSSGNSNEAS